MVVCRAWQERARESRMDSFGKEAKLRVTVWRQWKQEGEEGERLAAVCPFIFGLSLVWDSQTVWRETKPRTPAGTSGAFSLT